jgi:hemin uptake protein HemP
MEKERQEPKPRKIVNSEELFEGASELVIRHRADHYRLMITKAGKLILNK